MLIVSVLPLLAFALMLGSYFIHSRVQDTDQELTSRGQTIARLMAVSVEFGLLTGNQPMLAGQLRAPLQQEDVADIVVLDRQFDELARRHDTDIPVERQDAYPRFEDDHGFFLAPVTTSGIAFLDSPELAGGSAEKEIIGWVVVVMSREATYVRQRDIVLNGIGLLVLGMVVALLLVSRFSRNIIGPVVDLTGVVQEIQSGNYRRRAREHARGELQVLARGFNRMAERIEESNRSLEARVEEKTRMVRRTLADLERKNNDLTRARERADRANVAKDEFLARMSHELRTPLTSVLGFSRMLSDTELNPDQREFTRIINHTSNLLLSIIDDILDFSKLESNAISLEALPFSLADCVQDVLEMLAPVAHEKRIELVLLLDPELPMQVLGDQVRVRQVLSNLVSNALKFTDQGQVLVSLTPGARNGTIQTVQLQIQDTGIGIPARQAKNLFRAFSQADTSITRRYGGSGLGLAIARRLVQLMGGSIDLQSEENRGTEVTLDVPFPVVTPAMRVSQPLLERALIYDANPQARKSARYQLHRVVNRTQSVSSPQAVLDTLNQLSFDAVFVGIGPQDELSHQLVDWLAKVRALHRGRLVLLSGQQRELPDTLAVDQLRKPLQPKALQTLLQPDGEAIEVSDPAGPSLLPASTQILVAEDNNFNRLLLRRVLERAGAQVLEVISGVEAVVCAEEFDPALILMDVHMPEMDGIEATSRIRQAGYRKPILALTANVVDSEHEALRAAGVNEVLLKPIDDRLLIEQINRYLGEVLAPLPDNGEQGTDLSRYEIGQDQLHNELESQLEGLHQAFSASDRERLRHHTHQLIGLAGLYDMPELEVVSVDLNRAAKQLGMRDIWQQLWRLRRLIEHQQY
ncbi:ATP-binding protein [Marinobacterium arenosum]|uniref:ATP-binding protein n=1 Tax=Marinobacterium arenosum TaxID=2862496 RepID=UPI001C98529B|nr:ATP-binding protein [Marinobacterium arenosum]MBY4677553.1 response regulator [Marinobacterium arenosum]